MKITVQKKKLPKEVNWKNLAPGTIVEGEGGKQAMVYRDANGPALLLIGPGRGYHLQKVMGFMANFNVYKIIGKITEIIVEEE